MDTGPAFSRAFFVPAQSRPQVLGICISLKVKKHKLMKNHVTAGLLLLALMVAFPIYAQRKPRIKGNRSVISVEKPLPSFSHLVLSDAFELNLQEGTETAIRIEADDNLIDILRFEVEGDTLRVDSFYRITSSKKLGLTLVYQELHSIRAEAGSIACDQPLKADRLDLELQGGARMQLNIKAALVDLRMVENTWADLRVQADSLHASLQGYTDAHIYSSGGDIDVAMTGLASLGLEGVSPGLTASLTDNASLKASGIRAESATVLLNTSATAHVYATSDLAYEGRGNARLYVYGQPGIRILGLFDRAELHKVPE